MLILRVCFIMVSSITSFDENLTYYSISFKEHSNSYNFSDIDDPVINFLYLFFQQKGLYKMYFFYNKLSTTIR